MQSPLMVAVEYVASSACIQRGSFNSERLYESKFRHATTHRDVGTSILLCKSYVSTDLDGEGTRCWSPCVPPSCIDAGKEGDRAEGEETVVPVELGMADR